MILSKRKISLLLAMAQLCISLSAVPPTVAAFHANDRSGTSPIGRDFTGRLPSKGLSYPVPRFEMVLRSNKFQVASEVTANEVQVGSRIIRLPTRGTRVRLFYPTTEAASAEAAESEGNGGGMAYAPYGTDGRSLGLAFLLAQVSSRCVENAPLAGVDGSTTGANDRDSDNNKLPLLIYSHGIGGNMDMATRLFRTVACKKVIVAALEHTDGTASSTVRADGSELKFNSYLMSERQQLAWRAQELLEAVECVPEELDRLGSFKDGVVGPVVLGGHGYGATSAVMAANGAPANSTVCGLILHDPTLGMGYGMLPPNKGYNRLPTVTYVSDKYSKAGKRYGTRTLHVRGGRHENFGDALLWGASRWTRLVDPFEVHEQLAESMTTFLRTRDAVSSVLSNGSLLEVVR